MTQWAYQHRRSVLFTLVLFALAGLWVMKSLPVSLFPQVIFPRIVINMDAGDKPAERMVIEATITVEEAVRAVPGVLNVRSTTTRGSTDVAINFVWDIDMVSAMLQVESAINQIRTTLPPTLAFTVRRMEPTVFPVLGYSLTASHQSAVTLRDIATYQIRPLLSTIAGVAKVEVLGGALAEYQVIVDSAKLRAFNLSIDEIAKLLATSNVLQAVGRLEQNYKLYLLLADHQYQTLEQISNTVLRQGSSGLLLLKDVAKISKTTAPQWQRVTADGKDAVLFQIIQQPDGSTVNIAQAVQEKLAVLKKSLPADVKIAKWYDQSDLIVASAGTVKEALLIGLSLAVVTLLVFLRNGYVTLIAAITVPMALAATTLILYVMGQSFNIMTLGGMAAAVALIIDDAIVMIEHIMRRLHEGVGNARERIQAAATEFSKPLAASSAATIVTHIPLAFLSGVSGGFFKALSLTIASVLSISFLVAWLAVPLLAARALTKHPVEKEKISRLTQWFHDTYTRLMQVLLPRPWLILTALALLLAGGFYAERTIGSGFMPSMDEGGFILDYRAESGTSVTETDRLLRQVESIVQQTPEVETYSRRTGLSLGGHITEANEGDFFIKLKPMPRRSLDDIMDSMRSEILTHVPGLEIEMAKLMADMIGDLTAVPQPIEIKLYADDGELLTTVAEKVADALGKIQGVVDINNGVIPAGDALTIRVLPEQAALAGLSSDEIKLALNAYLTGTLATQLQEGIKMLNLRVWIPEHDRANTYALKQLPIRTATGQFVPLQRVAEITTVTGQPQIHRDNLKRMVAITARLNGRDLGSAITAIEQTLKQPNMLPRGVYYVLGGLYAEQQTAFTDMLVVFIAAVALVFVLLLAVYESFRVAVAMILTTLSSMAAVFIGLLLTHTELNIMAIMGMTMVIGIVTEVAVFYYSEYENLPNAEQQPWQHLIDAGINRMRPIAMTTLAAIFALLPLALGLGAGAEMLQPLAIALIFGLVIQIPLVLLVLPGFLQLFRVHLTKC
ncbi:efflux RND transporter permease subunit [Crenothrix sp.]|uniref:efflux RND transporter permease subunit n=1 Tax=Crenothrix sp. TaxID=3100433 RepID=UPI00374D0CB9